MKQFKKIALPFFALLLSLGIVCLAAACGDAAATIFTVTVLCKDAGIAEQIEVSLRHEDGSAVENGGPQALTEGKVYFELPAATYKVALSGVPEGYQWDPAWVNETYPSVTVILVAEPEICIPDQEDPNAKGEDDEGGETEKTDPHTDEPETGGDSGEGDEPEKADPDISDPNSEEPDIGGDSGEGGEPEKTDPDISDPHTDEPDTGGEAGEGDEPTISIEAEYGGTWRDEAGTYTVVIDIERGTITVDGGDGPISATDITQDQVSGYNFALNGVQCAIYFISDDRAHTQLFFSIGNEFISLIGVQA